VRYMLATELALRVYRHTDTSALRALLSRYKHPLPTLRSLQHDDALLIKEAFDYGGDPATPDPLEPTAGVAAKC
jgi:hypothetical protein